MPTPAVFGAGAANQQPPRNPDRLPDSQDPSGPCPRCGRPSNFQLIGQIDVSWATDGGYVVSRERGYERPTVERATVLMCAYCQQGVVVIEEQWVGGAKRGARQGGGVVSWHGIHWWPTPGASSLGPEVPENVAAAYDEGVRALSAGAPNASAAMFRTAIAYMVQDRGSEAAKSKRNLVDKIKQMASDGGPLGAVADWATHVRLTGNAGAHPDQLGDVSTEGAREVSRLVHTMIELLYIIPATIAKRQAGRPRRP